jgi:hypothetical protein
MPASSGSSYIALHDSTAKSYASPQSDLQPAIEWKLNPKIINKKTKTALMHFFAMILTPSGNRMNDSSRLSRSVE